MTLPRASTTALAAAAVVNLTGELVNLAVHFCTVFFRLPLPVVTGLQLTSSICPAAPCGPAGPGVPAGP